MALAYTSLRWPGSMIADLTVPYGGEPEPEATARAALRAGLATIGFGCLAPGLAFLAIHEFRTNPPPTEAWTWGAVSAAVFLVLFGWLGLKSYRWTIEEVSEKQSG